LVHELLLTVSYWLVGGARRVLVKHLVACHLVGLDAGVGCGLLVLSMGVVLVRVDHLVGIGGVSGGLLLGWGGVASGLGWDTLLRVPVHGFSFIFYK
jgi:hypothetical protein